MLAIALIVIGVGLMSFGGVMLTGWVSGKARWFNASVYDRQGTSKTDRLFVYVYFMALVIAPLLGGALTIVAGLVKLMA